MSGPNFVPADKGQAWPPMALPALSCLPGRVTAVLVAAHDQAAHDQGAGNLVDRGKAIRQVGSQ